MSAQFTPGPWRFVSDVGAHVIRQQRSDGEFDLYIATTWGGEHEANARLISAAPDLLEALKVARDCIRQDRTSLADAHMNPVTNEVDEDGAAGVAEYDAVLSQIEVAIAKATGEAA